ncbi:MAG TPA: hypothetical protein VN030_11585 [Cellvibrio sp.]|nr:hypothetical protein [Cellvibrio sp.]
MSLLNDMLRDLVKQQKVLTTPAAYSQDIFHETKLLKRASNNWVPSAVIFVAVFAAVLGFKYFVGSVELSRHLPFLLAFQQAPSRELLPVAHPAQALATPPAVQVPAEVAVTAAESQMVAADASAEDATATELSVDEEQVVVDDPEQMQRDIADFLLQANRALAEDKLTAPADDNAYSYFQSILTLSPSHQQAKIGLELIAARYLEKAREQLNLGNYDQVDIYSRRANFVAPEYFRDHDFTSAEKSMMQNALLRATKISEGQGARSESHTAAAPAAQSVAVAADPAKLQSETIKPFVVAESTSLNVVPNAAWKDEQMAVQARELVNQGNAADAIKLLKNFVVSESRAVQSLKLLGDLYFQQANAEALAVLVQSSDFLSAPDKAKLKAQMLVVQGSESAAIDELEKQLSEAGNNESYAAFLASLYHKTGRYQQSIVSYQRLLNDYGDKPAYWLGLALAFDGLAQPANALQAYQHLSQFPQLQEQVRNYINQRITALRTE